MWQYINRNQLSTPFIPSGWTYCLVLIKSNISLYGSTLSLDKQEFKYLKTMWLRVVCAEGRLSLSTLIIHNYIIFSLLFNSLWKCTPKKKKNTSSLDLLHNRYQDFTLILFHIKHTVILCRIIVKWEDLSTWQIIFVCQVHLHLYYDKTTTKGAYKGRPLVRYICICRPGQSWLKIRHTVIRNLKDKNSLSWGELQL